MSNIVKNYYEQHAESEWGRRAQPYSNIEFKSTLALIDKYFPAAGSVCDIGSGPGRYSIELLKKGYAVTLFELAASELELAAVKIGELGLTAEAYVCGDAREMNGIDSKQYGAALVLGPLYHLLEEDERLKVIRETARILEPGGVALFGYINSWGTLKAGVTEFSESFRDLQAVYRYLGEQKLDQNQGFTECYFTTPPQGLKEVSEGGFQILSYAGAESFLSGTQTEISRLFKDDSAVYENLLLTASKTCEFPAFRDATEHLIIVARKE